MSENQAEKSEMSATFEMAELVRVAAGPRRPDESVKAAIARAARCLGFTRGRSLETENLRNDLAQAQAYLARLEEALFTQDAGFYREQIGALGHQRRKLDRAGNSDTRD